MATKDCTHCEEMALRHGELAFIFCVFNRRCPTPTTCREAANAVGHLLPHSCDECDFDTKALFQEYVDKVNKICNGL